VMASVRHALFGMAAECGTAIAAAPSTIGRHYAGSILSGESAGGGTSRSESLNFSAMWPKKEA
jgi:hypothetical protein